MYQYTLMQERMRKKDFDFYQETNHHLYKEKAAIKCKQSMYSFSKKCISQG